MDQNIKNLLKDCHLDHVAIAVEDLDKSQKLYELIGFQFETHREVVESQAVETAFAYVDSNSKIELLCPHGEDGPIHKFLQKNGPGIHHLCFRVSDIEAKTKELREAGLRFIYESSQSGAGGCLVNFIHPKSTGGVLIELSQKQV